MGTGKQSPKRVLVNTELQNRQQTAGESGEGHASAWCLLTKHTPAQGILGSEQGDKQTSEVICVTPKQKDASSS